MPVAGETGADIQRVRVLMLMTSRRPRVNHPKKDSTVAATRGRYWKYLRGDGKERPFIQRMRVESSKQMKQQLPVHLETHSEPKND